jgi:hypothetical protein
MRERVMPPWALILAGGDGTWRRPPTTMERFARFERQTIAVTRAHEPYDRVLTHQVPPRRLVIRPEAG